jgi:hypothetical protein
MKNILVYVYAYKSKELSKSISELVDKSSGINNLIFYVYDQTNVNREDKFDRSIIYNHIIWDRRGSRFRYRDLVINHNNTDYTLIVNGSVSFEKDWDTRLIDLVDSDKDVVSGFGKYVFDENYKFFPSYTVQSSDSVLETGWVSKHFMFTKSINLKSILDISFLKYNGEEVMLSLSCKENGLKVYSLPTDSVSVLDIDLEEHDYIPFSKNHNYNLVIDTVQNGSNRFGISKSSVERLSEQIGYDLSKLSRLPYPTNDEEYDPIMNIDSFQESRFAENFRSLY